MLEGIHSLWLEGELGRCPLLHLVPNDPTDCLFETILQEQTTSLTGKEGQETGEKGTQAETGEKE